jgi:hypothetical protein
MINFGFSSLILIVTFSVEHITGNLADHPPLLPRVFCFPSTALGGQASSHGLHSQASGPCLTVIDTAVPEPCTMLLVGSGLVGLVAYRKRLKRA